MKLLFKNTEISKMLGGKKYKMEVKVELTSAESQVVANHGLMNTLLYKAEAHTDSFRQYGSGVGIAGLDMLTKLLTKKKIPEIMASSLMFGLTFEDDFILSLIATKQVVIEAAIVFDTAIKASSVFIGEQSLDIPPV
jgi:hypothetical protein